MILLHPSDPLVEDDSSSEENGDEQTSSMSEAAVEERIDYSSLTKSQLQELLTERNVEWTTSMVKADLIELAEGSE